VHGAFKWYWTKISEDQKRSRKKALGLRFPLKMSDGCKPPDSKELAIAQWGGLNMLSLVDMGGIPFIEQQYLIVAVQKPAAATWGLRRREDSSNLCTPRT